MDSKGFEDAHGFAALMIPGNRFNVHIGFARSDSLTCQPCCNIVMVARLDRAPFGRGDRDNCTKVRCERDSCSSVAAAEIIYNCWLLWCKRERIYGGLGTCK